MVPHGEVGASPSSLARRRRWAIVRIVLGFAQMFGATLGFLLITQQGVTSLSLTIFVLTTLCTASSVWLFRVRRRDR
jgi:ABC-type thiamin/hydroxymethylpyrimidine transport system permease subunit